MGKVTHGLTGTRMYNKFNQIRTRCYNKNDHNYQKYGARGINMHEIWRENPTLFISYIKSLPNYNKEGYSLDRVMNDENYEPMNLKWSTSSEQALNRRVRGAIKEKYIIANKDGRQPFRVYKGKRHYTIESALLERKEKYGF